MLEFLYTAYNLFVGPFVTYWNALAPVPVETEPEEEELIEYPGYGYGAYL